MRVTSIKLQDFRNLSSLSLQPSPGVNIIYGENAQGKTNILESLYYLSLIGSFRATYDRELVRFGTAAAYLEASLFADGRQQELEIRIPFSGGRREIQINHVKVSRKADAAGLLKCVLFCPEDLDLIRGAAAKRRRFLDDAISQLWPHYIALIGEYTRIYQHKSRILKDFRDNPSMLDTLDDFTAQLLRVAANIIPYRARFIRMLEKFAAEEHAAISGGREELTLSYQTVSTIENPELTPPEIYDLLWEHYVAHRSAELATGSLLTGPHKDDLQVLIGGLPAKTYASQGQTRTAVLSLKLAQRALYYQETGEYPVLLFDDVLSELDRGRQEYVLRGIDRGQVFITTCESDLIAELHAAIGGTQEQTLFHVKQGSVTTQS